MSVKHQMSGKIWMSGKIKISGKILGRWCLENLNVWTNLINFSFQCQIRISSLPDKSFLIWSNVSIKSKLITICTDKKISSIKSQKLPFCLTPLFVIYLSVNINDMEIVTKLSGKKWNSKKNLDENKIEVDAPLYLYMHKLYFFFI